MALLCSQRSPLSAARHCQARARAIRRRAATSAGLRWFRDRTTPDALARDHGISRATAYRYLDEVIAVLAGEAPDLSQALERASGEGLPHVILDGTIIQADRCRQKTVSVRGEPIDLC